MSTPGANVFDVNRFLDSRSIGRAHVVTVVLLIFTMIVNRLTERMDFEGSAQKRNRYRLLFMIDEFPSLKRMEIFADALSYMAGYGLKAFLIAQSLNQIEKAYGPNNAILDNCHVRVSFATNDERTAKRVSDALGTATEMRAMKNYAGHRLSPWLGHLMVSRSETARQLLTPGEVMQLPPDDEIVMVAGVHPIRAKKARYYQDRRLSERIAPAPAPQAAKVRPDDWTGRQASADPKQVARIVRDAEDAANGGLRREPELPEHVAIAPETTAPPSQEFAIVDDDPDDAARQAAVRRRMQGLARQASLDPGDGIEL